MTRAGQSKPGGKHIVLIGGGHAHVAVLADWIRRGVPRGKSGAVQATLVTPSRHLRYSGMVPGWIAGQYSRAHGLVEVAALAERAGARLLLGKCAEIDPDTRNVVTEDNQKIAFDIASIDTGGVGRADHLLGSGGLGLADNLLDIRPIDRFVDRLASLYEPQRGGGEGEGEGDRKSGQRIAIIGGGAGGTELAFALRNRADWRVDLTFVTGARGLLPDHASRVRALAAKELQRQGIEVIAADARFEAGQFLIGEKPAAPFDLVIAALGSGAPDWPRASGLACDKHGFIAVDAHQRSISHPHIFAAGDVAARQDSHVPHSGVHAVFAGPVLAKNLRASVAGLKPSSSYYPRWNNLYLISTGDRRAIASYGPFAAHGAWTGRLKHWIDNRWIRKYAELSRSN